MGKKRKASKATPNTEEAPSGSKQERRDNVHASDKSDASTMETASSEIENIQDSYNTTTKATVVLHASEQQAAAEDQASFHRNNGNYVVLEECRGIDSLKEMKLEHCNRLDMLVDANMYTILMEGERFNDVAKAKFEELADRNTKVWVISKVAEDFEQLFHCIPKKIRRKCEEAAVVHSVAQTGMTDGTANNCNVCATVGGNQLAVNNTIYGSNKEHGQIDASSSTTINKIVELLLESSEGNVDRVNEIISENTIDIQAPGKQGRTAIMQAAQSGKLKVVKLLKNANCNMTRLDDKGNNLLHVACMGGFRRTVKYIISLKIFDINKRGEMGMTALMMAAFKANVNVFNLLLDKGCDTTGVDISGDNILHLACRGESEEIVSSILSKKDVEINSRGDFGRTAVMKAAAVANDNIVKILISNECDLKATDGDGNNVLHIACLGGSLDVVQRIVQEGSVGIETKGRYDWTPVMMAAEQGHYEVFEYLAEKKKCNLKHKDPRNNNIFHTAAIGGNVKIVQYLLEKSVDGKEKENQFGIKPSQTALQLKNSIVSIMINGQEKTVSKQFSQHFR